MKAILLDIEGTTTPIDFVHKTLFPYARSRMAGFVQQNFENIKFEISQLEIERASDNDYTPDFRLDSQNSVADYLIYLIDNDRKSTPLKSIQGMIWQTGYENGDLVSSVYHDVPKAFERWKNTNKTISIYSSGSVLAQQLIFKYSNHGDLTRFISHYFDTNIGHKRDRKSYTTIASEIELASSEILFVSDISAELDAASAAGCQTALSVRDRTEQSVSSVHFQIANFDELAADLA